MKEKSNLMMAFFHEMNKINNIFKFINKEIFII